MLCPGHSSNYSNNLIDPHSSFTVWVPLLSWFYNKMRQTYKLVYRSLQVSKWWIQESHQVVCVSDC